MEVTLLRYTVNMILSVSILLPQEQILVDRPNFWLVLYIKYNFVGFEATSGYLSTNQSTNPVCLRYPPSRLWNHTRFADCVTVWIVLLPERTKTGHRTRLCG